MDPITFSIIRHRLFRVVEEAVITLKHVSGSAITQDVLVSGMTCSHCVSSVTEELAAVDGVDSVSVDLIAGGPSRVTIHSAIPVDSETVKAAIEEAGYTVASAPA